MHCTFGDRQQRVAASGEHPLISLVEYWCFGFEPISVSCFVGWYGLGDFRRVCLVSNVNAQFFSVSQSLVVEITVLAN